MQFIIPLGSLIGMDVGGGRNAAGIDCLDLLGVLENFRKLPREEVLLLVGQLEVRERRDSLDVSDRENRGHVRDGTMVRASWPM